jgi:hypothetical protein
MKHKAPIVNPKTPAKEESIVSFPDDGELPELFGHIALAGKTLAARGEGTIGRAPQAIRAYRRRAPTQRIVLSASLFS